MKKKIMVCVLATALLAGCGKVKTVANGDEALATFKDGSKITVNEVWEELKNSYGLDLLLEKIDNKILTEEYKSKKSDVDDYIKSYETYIKSNYVDDNGKFDEDALLNDLASAGFSSLDAYLSTQRTSYLKDLATTDYAKGKITEKEINSYYKSDIVGDINCLHILVKPASDSSTDLKKAEEKAKTIITAIEKDIKSGTKAKAAFEKYKDNKDVIFQDLEYFNKGEMDKAFENAAFALKKGAYSKTPVKTSYGYHVILKVDEKEKASLKDSRDKILEDLAANYITKNKQSVVETNALVELRKKYGVDIEDDDLDSRYGKYINYLINTK